MPAPVNTWRVTNHGMQVAHERRERHRAVDEVVLVAAVRVALAVASCSCRRRSPGPGRAAGGPRPSTGRGSAPPPCRTARLAAGRALGRGVLGVRVVDVVAGAVGEHRVDEMGLDLGRLRAVAGEAAGVAAGRLVVEVPADPVLLDVPVDQQRRREDRVRVGGAAERDAVLGLDAARSSGRPRLSLPARVSRVDPHARSRRSGALRRRTRVLRRCVATRPRDYPVDGRPRRCLSRYWPVVTRSI